MDNLYTELLDQHMKLFAARESDIYFRGSDCEVYGIDGSISSLRSTIIWADNKGNYVKPKEVKRRRKYCFSCNLL